MAFSDFIYNFQNDPDRNKKILFFGGWFLIFMLIGGGIWFLNNPSTPTPETDIPDIAALNDSILKSGATKFPEAISLKAVNNRPVKNDRSFIADSMGNPVFVAENNNFMVGETAIAQNFPFQAPLSIYQTKLGYVVNDYFGSAFLLKDESGYKVKPSADGIGQIIPLNTGVDDFGFTSLEEFFFLVKSNDGYSMKKSKTIQLDNFQDVGSINSEIAKKGYYQAFRSRNSIIVAVFENPAQQGKSEYWLYKNGRLEKFLEVADSWSTLVQENFLIITRKSLYSDLVSSYINDIYDLTGDIPNKVDFNAVFSIRQLGLYGNMIARRCAITPNSEIYCLMKERPVKSDDTSEPDLVAKINLSKKSAEILSTNKTIPASSSLITDIIRNRLLIVNKKDLLVYEMPLS